MLPKYTVGSLSESTSSRSECYATTGKGAWHHRLKFQKSTLWSCFVIAECSKAKWMIYSCRSHYYSLSHYKKGHLNGSFPHSHNIALWHFTFLMWREHLHASQMFERHTKPPCSISNDKNSTGQLYVHKHSRRGSGSAYITLILWTFLALGLSRSNQLKQNDFNWWSSNIGRCGHC